MVLSFLNVRELRYGYKYQTAILVFGTVVFDLLTSFSQVLVVRRVVLATPVPKGGGDTRHLGLRPVSLPLCPFPRQLLKQFTLLTYVPSCLTDIPQQLNSDPDEKIGNT